MLMPGQVAALRRRLELLQPTRDRLQEQVDALAAQRKASTGGDKAESDRVARQETRLRHELNAVSGEMATLLTLVEARLGRNAT